MVVNIYGCLYGIYIHIANSNIGKHFSVHCPSNFFAEDYILIITNILNSTYTLLNDRV